MKALRILGILVGALLVVLAGVWLLMDPPTYPRGARTNPPSLTDDAVVLSDGARLPLRSWGVAPAGSGSAPPRAIVIALHGAGTYSGIFEPFATALADAGIATYAYDQRGHGGAPNLGKWAGTGTLVADMNEVVDVIRAAHPATPVYLAGYSLGGSVLLNAAAADQYPAVKGTILISPGVNIGRRLAWPSRVAMNLGARLAPETALPRPKEIDTGLTDDPGYAQFLRKDPVAGFDLSFGYGYGAATMTDTAMPGAARLKTPTLLLYGERDVSVSPAEHAEVGRRLAAPKRVIAYPEGFHVLIWERQRDAVFRDIVQWIDEDLRTVPRG